MRPAPSRLWRAQTGTEQAACWALLAVLAALPLLGAVLVIRQGWQPAGDVALIGLRVRDILRGHPALIGQPTTGENFGSGIAGSHPGPIEFYVLAPFVALLGSSAGLPLGAAAINASALGATLWLAVRRGGFLLAVATAAVLALLLRALGGPLLHDAVSSNVGTLPALLVLFAAWSVVAGDLRVAPLFVAAGCFALQDHLVYLGTVGPVVAVALLAAWMWIRRHRGRRAWSRVRRPVAAASVLGVVLWLPVLVDEAVGDHNLLRTWRTFTGGGAVPSGALFGFQRLFVTLTPVPLFARRSTPLGYLEAAHPLGVAVVLCLLAALAAVTWLAGRERRTDLVAASAVAWAALAAGLLSAAKMPVDAGIQPSNLRWMWTTGAFVWLVLGWSAWELAAPVVRDRGRWPVRLIAAALLMFGVVGVVTSTRLAVDRDGWFMPSVPRLVADVRRDVPAGSFVVRFADQGAAATAGPALVHALDGLGYRLHVEAGPISRAYGRDRIYRHEPVDGALVVATTSRRPEAGLRLIARSTILHPGAGEPDQIVRVYRGVGG